MPTGTAFHDRTFALCESLNYREWSGYYTVSAYETHHEHEYNAIRNSAALIDISPLFKYRITGPDATRLLDRIVTRDMRRVSEGQVIYTPWCDERGKVIDDGTVSRLDENTYRWTAADPSLRWFHQNAAGMDVDIEDISRTGYTGDLGYEIWLPWSEGGKVWDALMQAGRAFDIRPAGMLALDVARIEAGLLLIDVDFNSSKKAMIESQKYSPLEMGLARLVHLDKERFVGQAALLREQERGHVREIAGLEINWPDVEHIFENIGLPPTMPAAASRVPVPVFKNANQIGKATSTTWSPTLKKLIALATVKREFARPGTNLEMEMTVEAVRHRVGATVVKTPFFNPKRKTATPIHGTAS